MSDISVLIHGLGNIGQCVIEAVEASSDIKCLGVIRSKTSLGSKSMALRGCSEFGSLEELLASGQAKPQVAIICGPSRQTEKIALHYLQAGLNTVDSFDIHKEIPQLLTALDGVSKANGRVAVSAAGWDPGSDSVIRALFEAMTPVGTTFTNFGPGRSMGHSVAARAIEGVRDAISITIPTGGGRHSRLVYVLAEETAGRDKIKLALLKDSYFSNDPLDLRFVENAAELAAVVDNSHGVLLERVGASAFASNQRLSFDMRIDNPALTAQMLVSVARASTRMPAGSYSLIDIPPVALLPGERMDNIARLV